MECPCENCIIMSVCISDLLNLQREYKDDELIVNDIIVNEDVYNDFYVDSIVSLSTRCELFKSYFPYSITYPGFATMVSYPEFKTKVTHEEWSIREEKIVDMFDKYYPNVDF